MSAQRYALNNFIRNGPRFVSFPHPTPNGESREREELIIGNGLVESVLPYVNFVKYVPLSLHLWSPAHKVSSNIVEEQLANSIEWPPLPSLIELGPESKICSTPLTAEVSVQTDDDFSKKVDVDERMDKLRWELENTIGEEKLSCGAHDEAFSRFKLSAEHGHVNAMINLAEAYSDGMGCKKSMRKAYEWWERAACAGDVDSLYQIAVCHLWGEGVARSVPIGREMMKKAAEKGSESAAYYMVVLLFREGRAHEAAQFIRTALKSEENEREMKSWLDRGELDLASKIMIREHIRHG